VTTLVLTTAFARAAPVMGAFLFARYLHTHGEQAVFASLDYTPSGFRDEIVASGVPIHSFRLGGWTGMRKRGVVQKYVDARGIDVVMSDGLRPDIVASGLRGITPRIERPWPAARALRAGLPHRRGASGDVGPGTGAQEAGRRVRHLPGDRCASD